MIWVLILYNSSRGGCKEFYSQLYSLGFQLRYVPLFGHHKKFCRNSCSFPIIIYFLKSFHYVFLFCIKTAEWHFKRICLCSLIIMMPRNRLDSIGAGASSRHDIDEVFLDYSDFNIGAKLISFQNYIWMYEILQRGWICRSNITIKCFLSDCICLRRFIHYLPQ